MENETQNSETMPQNVIELLKGLHEKDPKVRAAVTQAVKRLDDNEKEELLNCLQSQKGELRCDAATALCLLDAEKYIPAIINLLNDPLDYVRWDISGLLHDFGDYRAVEPLIAVLLNDTDSDVRHNACYALSAIGDSSALPALRYAVENDSGTDYEGRPISEIANEAIKYILERTEK